MSSLWKGFLAQHKIERISLKGWEVNHEGKITLDVQVAYKDMNDVGCGITKSFLVPLPDDPDSQDWLAFGLPNPNEN